MNVIHLFWEATVNYCKWLWGTISFTGESPLWGNYFWYLTFISVLFFLWELVNPWRKKQKLFRKDFWLDFSYMYFNFFAFYILLFAGLEKVSIHFFEKLIGVFGLESIAWIKMGAWHPAWQIIVVFLVTDFTQWNIHRLLHRVPFLWRFHKLHHSVKEMGFSAHLRFHWMESVLYRGIGTLPVAMLGANMEYAFIMHMVTIAWGHFNHANIYFPLGPLKYLFNTPQMHLWHHAKKLPSGTYGVNYGITLSLWDYLFGTNHMPNDKGDLELGFEGEDNYPSDFLGQQIDPFKKR